MPGSVPEVTPAVATGSPGPPTVRMHERSPAASVPFVSQLQRLVDPTHRHPPRRHCELLPGRARYHHASAPVQLDLACVHDQSERHSSSIGICNSAEERAKLYDSRSSASPTQPLERWSARGKGSTTLVDRLPHCDVHQHRGAERFFPAHSTLSVTDCHEQLFPAPPVFVSWAAWLFEFLLHWLFGRRHKRQSPTIERAWPSIGPA